MSHALQENTFGRRGGLVFAGEAFKKGVKGGLIFAGEDAEVIAGVDKTMREAVLLGDGSSRGGLGAGGVLGIGAVRVDAGLRGGFGFNGKRHGRSVRGCLGKRSIGLTESGFASCLLLFALNGATHGSGNHLVYNSF
jgi:hypothetical protein